MSQVKTNNTSFSYTRESSLGVLPGSPIWKLLEPNSIETFGMEIASEPRRPISRSRGRRKAIVTDADSAVEFEGDVTVDAFVDFAECFVYAEFANVEFDLTHAKVKGSALNATGTGYAFGAQLNTFTNGTLLAGKMVFASGGAITLVFAKGYALSANNGLKPLNADVTGTSTEVTVSGLSAETAPANASVMVAGIRTDDLTLTISGSTATLVSAGDITNWATYGLRAGMYIHIGSATTAGVVQNAYSTNTVYGWARISSISGATLNLDKLDAKLTGGPHSPATIDVMFGRFARNVLTTDAADDTRYLEQSIQFEGTYPDLGGVGTPEYEYAIGNLADEMALNLPLTSKSTVTFGFVGQRTEDITATRKTGASSARVPLRTAGFGTSTNIARLSTDVVSSVSDVCFKSATLTLNNNTAGEKCLGTLGAMHINTGQFEVSLEAQLAFTRKEIVNAVINSTTVTFDAIIANEDGGVAFDLPTLTFGGGDREFPLDATVLVNLTGETFTSPTLGYDVGINVLVGVPWIRT
jgi:hypothetical protein